MTDPQPIELKDDDAPPVRHVRPATPWEAGVDRTDAGVSNVDTTRQGSGKIYALRTLMLLLVFAISAGALVTGLQLRDWLWTYTASIRFHGDINNGFNRGSVVYRDALKLMGDAIPAQTHIPMSVFFRSWVDGYDRAVENRPNGNFELDYPPLRLMVMSLWVKHVREHTPDVRGWKDEYTTPLLHFNSVMEFVSCIGVFLVVRLWLIRRARRTEPPGRLVVRWRENAIALTGALLLWFNPAVLHNAHAWPQWDVWLVPFFIFAIFFASTERWTTAGVLLGVGAMLKGQILFVAPVIPLWALFSGKPFGALKCLIGFALAWALITSPWLVRTPRAAWMVGSATVGAVALASFVAWRWRARRAWRGAWVIVPVTFISTVVLAGVYLEGTWSWFRVGFAYGTRQYRTLAMGPIGNLPAILAKEYKWELGDDLTRITLPGREEPTPIPIRSVLIGAYGLTVVLCAIGAAVHARRSDPRVLLALVAPWVTFFALTPQMHERYLLWGAAFTCVAVAVSMGWTLMHLLVMALALLMTLASTLPSDPNFAPMLLRFTRGAIPGIGWMTLLVAMIFLYGALPKPRRPDASLR